MKRVRGVREGGNRGNGKLGKGGGVRGYGFEGGADFIKTKQIE